MSAPAVVVALKNPPTPIAALRMFADDRYARLLHSAATNHPLSRFSYLTAWPTSIITAAAESWPATEATIRDTIGGVNLRADLPPFQGGWVGWIGYETGRAFTTQPAHRAGPARAPEIALTFCDWVIAWDHAEAAAWIISSGARPDGSRDEAFARGRAQDVARRLTTYQSPSGPASGRAGPLRPDVTAGAYRSWVARVIEQIRAGDIFQANIAQRFTASYAGDPVTFYQALLRRSPAPMAALIRHDGVTIASASPERFLTLRAADRCVETRPIKGTRPRGADPASDQQLRAELDGSEKDRAENVMIVDVLRNDLSRVCDAGSVAVCDLCAVETHPTVHHMVSTVLGRLRPGRDALDLLAAAFPGGSVTGAPKARAMDIISNIEPGPRGVYTGAILWIGLDGSLDSSIAIRTATIADDTLSFHVGGGVTALSAPEAEYGETMDKAAPLIAALDQLR